MPSRPWIATVAASGLAGFVLLAIPGSGTQEIVGTILLSAMLVAVIGLIVVRLGPQSQPEREREAAAREEFDRTGHWPGE
ncbi:MAG TPA: hypothetical protein VGG41_14525 [Solirubrobacteraceae bacterium]|jgi:hypothetical protein